MRHAIALAAFAALIAGTACQTAMVADSGADLLAAANKEGNLVVYSVTSSVPALLEDFQRLYPGIKLDYVALDTGPLYDRVVSESKAGATADVLWSSAMDLQIKLVNDGYAARYESPEAGYIPSWANWRNEAFGTTFEPVGFVYNKTLLLPSEVPQTRAELLDMVAKDPARLKDRMTAFDPGKSGVGYLMMTQDSDAMAGGAFWNLAGALGAMHVFSGTGSGVQFERLARGESVLGYNLLASYATGRIKKDLPNLGIVLPKDHTLVVTRVMFISRNAAHPNAARLWVDYLLSKRGQEQLARADLGALRADVAGEMTPAALGSKLGSAVKPIPVGLDLLQHLDAARHDEFVRRWNAAMTGSH